MSKTTSATKRAEQLRYHWQFKRQLGAYEDFNNTMRTASAGARISTPEDERELQEADDADSDDSDDDDAATTSNWWHYRAHLVEFQYMAEDAKYVPVRKTSARGDVGDIVLLTLAGSMPGDAKKSVSPFFEMQFSTFLPRAEFGAAGISNTVMGLGPVRVPRPLNVRMLAGILAMADGRKHVVTLGAKYGFHRARRRGASAAPPTIRCALPDAHTGAAETMMARFLKRETVARDTVIPRERVFTFFFEFMHAEYAGVAAKIERNVEMRRFFMFELHRKLRKYYPLSVIDTCIVALGSRDIDRLCTQLLHKDPFPLCFRTDLMALGLAVAELTPTGYRNAVRDTELSDDEAIDDTETSICRQMVYAYAEMKSVYHREKHLLAGAADVMCRVRGTLRYDRMSDARMVLVLERLVEHNVLSVWAMSAADAFKNNGKVLLRYNSDCLTGIADSMAAVAEHFREHYAAEPVLVESGDDIVHDVEAVDAAAAAAASSASASSSSRRVSEPCSEQLKALAVYARSPFLVIDGPGGAGKSELLRMIVERYPHTRRLLSAFPNQVVSMLKSRLRVDDAYTMHRLVYVHAAIHAAAALALSGDAKTRAATAAKAKRDGTADGPKTHPLVPIEHETCIFEGIEEIIIDEMSVVSPDIFALLLHGLVTCGHLRRVILVGDRHQLKPIPPGDLWSDMVRAFRENGRTMLCEFRHNHRIEGASAAALPLLNLNSHMRTSSVEHVMASLTRVTARSLSHAHAHSAMLLDTSDIGHDPVRMAERTVEALRRLRRPGEAMEEFMLRHQVFTFTRACVNAMNKAIGAYYFTEQGMGRVVDARASGCYVRQKILFKKTKHTYDVSTNQLFYLREMYDIECKIGKDDARVPDLDRIVPTRLNVKWTGEPLTGGARTRILVCNPIIAGHCDRTHTMHIPLTDDMRGALRRANCITGHCFQGGQAPLIIYAMLDCSHYAGGFSYETNESLYTAVGRAEKTLLIMAPPDHLESTIPRHDSLRRTGIREVLRDKPFFKVRRPRVVPAPRITVVVDDDDEESLHDEESRKRERCETAIVEMKRARGPDAAYDEASGDSWL